MVKEHSSTMGGVCASLAPERDLYHVLPRELGDLLMLLVEQEPPVGALFLALTCRAERVRYRNLLPSYCQRTLRPFLIQLAANEGTLVDGGALRGYMLPHERGYAYYREREQWRLRRVRRNEERFFRARERRIRNKKRRRETYDDPW